MNSVRYAPEKLEALCREAFIRFGFSPEDAAQIAATLVLADFYGI